MSVFFNFFRGPFSGSNYGGHQQQIAEIALMTEGSIDLTTESDVVLILE